MDLTASSCALVCYSTDPGLQIGLCVGPAKEDEAAFESSIIGFGFGLEKGRQRYTKRGIERETQRGNTCTHRGVGCRNIENESEGEGRLWTHAYTYTKRERGRDKGRRRG